MEEIWKDIPDWEGMYQISSIGNIRSLNRPVKARGDKISIKKGKILKPLFDKDGYLHIGLYKEQKGYFRRLHRLVALAFIPNPENKPLVNHLNGIKDDNRVENLEWCTQQRNMQHAHKTGLKVNTHMFGEGCNFSKLNDEQILYIRASYDKKTNSYKKLAEQFNVSASQISNIIRRNNWKHI